MKTDPNELKSGTIYDLILHDGGYYINVAWPSDAAPAAHIASALPLAGAYRLPLLGKLLRNHWAKSRGAILTPLPH